MYEYFKRVVVAGNNISTIYVHSWTSKGLSNEQIKAPDTFSSNDQVPILECDGRKVSLKFSGDLLRQRRVKYNHGLDVSIFIACELNSNTINTDFALKNFLFGAVKIIKDKDPNNYVYSDYGIAFDSKSTLTYSDGSTANNVIIFGVDFGKSAHKTNRLANVLIFGKGLIQKINGLAVYADHEFPTNFTQIDKTFSLCLHYDQHNGSSLFVNGKKHVTFKAKNSEITPYKMCLGNISADDSAENAQKTGLFGNVYDFSVEYGVFSDFEIHDIHAYLMRKNGIVYILRCYYRL